VDQKMVDHTDIQSAILAMRVEFAAADERHRAHVERMISLLEDGRQLVGENCGRDNQLKRPELIVELLCCYAALLAQDGFDESQTIRRIDQLLGIHSLSVEPFKGRLDDYAVLIFKRDHPHFLANGEKALRDCVKRAGTKMRHQPVFESRGELCRLMSDEEYARVLDSRSEVPLLYRWGRHAIGMNQIVLRRQPGDEIWWWCRDELAWQALAGRLGLALVRGRTILAECVMLVN
jgi:hypothetical protein